MVAGLVTEEHGGALQSPFLQRQTCSRLCKGGSSARGSLSPSSHPRCILLHFITFQESVAAPLPLLLPMSNAEILRAFCASSLCPFPHSHSPYLSEMLLGRLDQLHQLIPQCHRIGARPNLRPCFADRLDQPRQKHQTLLKLRKGPRVAGNTKSACGDRATSPPMTAGVK